MGYGFTETDTKGGRRQGVLYGKTAVVTGSSSGIGLGMVRALARERCNVMMNGFGDADAIERQRSEIEQENAVDIAYHPADMRRPVEIRDLITTTQDKLGPIDILINNAGVLNTPPSSVEETEDQRWDDNIAVNLSAAFHTIRAALPQMRDRGWGRIVNTASACGLIALPNSAPYTASKHGVVGLTKAVALELVETDITCNAICPGLVETEFMSGRIAAAADKRGQSIEEITKLALRGRQPSGRLIKVPEIAALAVFLCSDAAVAINGAALPIDHAWTAM